MGETIIKKDYLDSPNCSFLNYKWITNVKSYSTLTLLKILIIHVAIDFNENCTFKNGVVIFVKWIHNELLKW
jgi:hypothetical protein